MLCSAVQEPWNVQDKRCSTILTRGSTAGCLELSFSSFSGLTAGCLNSGKEYQLCQRYAEIQHNVRGLVAPLTMGRWVEACADREATAVVGHCDDEASLAEQI